MARKKILLVDDADTILMIERMILSKGAYDFVTAKDGQEAIDKARTEKPDLILMDILMPKVDGFQACQKLRDDESTRSIPIIMVTTRGEANNVEQGYASGCNDYVAKPIDGIELLSKVRSYLGD